MAQEGIIAFNQSYLQAIEKLRPYSELDCEGDPYRGCFLESICETKLVVLEMKTQTLIIPDSQSHLLGLRITWKQSAAMEACTVPYNVYVALWIDHTNDITSRDFVYDPQLGILLEGHDDAVERIIRCHCGLDIQVSVFPSWHDIGLHSHAQFTLGIDATYLPKSEFYADTRLITDV